MKVRGVHLHDPYLIGNGRWCSCCFPDGPPDAVSYATSRRKRRGCNECAGAGRIAFTAEEIIAAYRTRSAPERAA